MRTKKVNRYYCDHCRKGGLSKHHMAKHELGCCRNPDRKCGMCRVAEIEQKPLSELISALRETGIDDVRKLTDCPACIMAAILQSGIQKPYAGEEDPGIWIEFDFKKERTRFFEDHTLPLGP
jgi:hypothetical protein